MTRRINIELFENNASSRNMLVRSKEESWTVIVCVEKGFFGLASREGLGFQDFNLLEQIERFRC